VNCPSPFMYYSYLHLQIQYLLAVLHFFLELFSNNQALVDDIGCAFKVTARKHPILQLLLEKMQMDFFIPAWHEWSHNCKGQLQHHPSH
jgi:hypothetical protein